MARFRRAHPTRAAPARLRRRAGAGRSLLARFPILRMVALFAVLGLLPLAVLTYVTTHLAEQAVVREVNARVSATSAVTAVLVAQQMQAVASLTESYASRPLLIAALGDGNAAQYQTGAIATHLAQLKATAPAIGGVFVADMGCRVRAVDPVSPGVVGADFSFRDWCKGVRRSDRPYVSEAYRTAILGHPLVIAVATIIRSHTGRPLGVLGVVVSLNAIRSFSARVALVQGIHLTITDGRGTVLVGPDGASAAGLVSAAADPRVRGALAGRSGILRSATGDGDALSAFAPVRSLGWSVIAEVPAQRALAGVRRLRLAVLGVAGVLGLVLLAGLILLARTLRLRREVERALLEREAHTRAILAAATDAFVSMDAAGDITAWNGRAEEIFGWTEAEVLGRKVAETIIPPASRRGHAEGLAHLLATGEGPVLNQRIEVSALHRGGREFPVELAVWPVRNQGVWSFNAFVHDITVRKQAEADLASARDMAVQASQLKSAFLANMSHEIRTPMNGVLGMTSLLLDTDLQADQREFAETVRASGEALMAIINDILDFSKIEAGRVDLESVDFDLRALLEGAARLLSFPAQAKGLELACSLPADLPDSVRGDPGRLRQVVINLVGNAVKFTSTGKVLLRISTESGADSSAVMRVEVVDTGIGIAVSDRSRVFESFSQADPDTTRLYGGTGLGLAISRQLVELMGGQIGVDSELGRGSTFWFTVPLETGAPLPTPPGPTSLAGLRMLVVDDDDASAAALVEALQSWGIRAEAAHNSTQAQAALAVAATQGAAFDVALLDQQVPGVEGIELTRGVLAGGVTQPVRLIRLVPGAPEETAEMLRESDGSAYLSKPVRRSELHDCLVAIMAPSDPLTGAVAGAGAAVPAARLPLPEAGRSGRILLAEDNSVNQRVAAAMLKSLGFGVDVVADGAEAVTAAGRTHYRAILMDCQMPGVDGYQATGQIRQAQAGRPRTPIIAVTASAMPTDRQRCLAADMDDYLSKPLDLAALAAVLARWAPDGRPPVERRQRQRQPIPR